MKVSEHVHQLKIEFQVTEEIKRFVYIYLIFGKKGVYLIDTGVDGAEQLIREYLEQYGRSLPMIKEIFLTHAHPDHLGAAYELKKESGCKVWGSKEEQKWMEDVNLEYKERPIPNYYTLLNKSVKLDGTYVNGEFRKLEEGITLQVLATPGHSAGSTSFYFLEEQVIFVGDAIPIVGDIPIYTSFHDSMKSLRTIKNIKPVTWYCPAWGEVWSVEEGGIRIAQAETFLQKIDDTVKKVRKERIKEARIEARKEQENQREIERQLVNENTTEKGDNNIANKKIILEVCKRMNMEKFLMNPLFRRSLCANIDNI
ncbi:MBL fold metallo-hydrolase [Anaerosporobacter faecicola]|uniref:MBL fold metallo-hydrolase n=1 Tax=Anaerosporobacter faecicola TaxID=2718714 RepID=UPI00143C6412|nr:MBL fold metallo-hydrolase [Anaerosporobacter faecicola]